MDRRGNVLLSGTGTMRDPNPIEAFGRLVRNLTRVRGRCIGAEEQGTFFVGAQKKTVIARAGRYQVPGKSDAEAILGTRGHGQLVNEIRDVRMPWKSDVIREVGQGLSVHPPKRLAPKQTKRQVR